MKSISIDHESKVKLNCKVMKTTKEVYKDIHNLPTGSNLDQQIIPS